MRVLYRHNKPEYGKRRMTVTGHYNSETSEMLFAVSVTRPGENFCKSVGRTQADLHIEEGRIAHRQSIPPEVEPKLGGFFKQIADLLIDAKQHELELRDLIHENLALQEINKLKKEIRTMKGAKPAKVSGASSTSAPARVTETTSPSSPDRV